MVLSYSHDVTSESFDVLTLPEGAHRSIRSRRLLRLRIIPGDHTCSTESANSLTTGGSCSGGRKRREPETELTPSWGRLGVSLSCQACYCLYQKIPALVASMTKYLETKRWNTSKLGLRIGADAVAAGAAGILVAPIITMIDKGIIENASGRNTLGDSLKGSLKELVSRPHRFLGSKPFALIYVRPLFPLAISH